MSKKLQSLLEQLTLAERDGAVLSAHASIPRNTRSPRAMRDEVYSAIAKVADESEYSHARISPLEK